MYTYIYTEKSALFRLRRCCSACTSYFLKRFSQYSSKYTCFVQYFLDSAVFLPESGEVLQCNSPIFQQKLRSAIVLQRVLKCSQPPSPQPRRHRQPLRHRQHPAQHLGNTWLPWCSQRKIWGNESRMEMENILKTLETLQESHG